jgi:general L-amino acid transport system substrate-binding protein
VRPLGRAGLLASAAVLSAAVAFPAAAGPVLDRVRASGAVSCGAEERPGFAEAGEPGAGPNEAPAHGLAVDLCRAVAVAVLGPGGRSTFTVIDSVADFDAARDGRLDVLFLTGGTLASERLADRVALGAPAFVETESVMVPEASSVRSVGDLAGASVCFMIGTGAQRALEGALERDRVAVKRLGFGEDVELRDAYNVGRCTAVAGDATFLAEVRQDGGVHGLKSRLLDAPLALDPVYLATGIEDGRWTAMAGWVLQALVLGSAPRSGFSGAGAEPLARAAAPLGFPDGWYGHVVAATGTYAELWARNLGDGSDLKLPPGPNQPWPAGVMVVPASP